MSNPVDTYPTNPAGTGQVLPPLPDKDPTKDPGGDVPMEPNPYMGGGGTPA